MGQLTSVGQPCDLRRTVDDDATQDPVSREPGGEQTPHERGRGKCRPLSEYVRFETEQGAMLLYEPSALDKWIGMCLRQDSGTGEFVNHETGRTVMSTGAIYRSTTSGETQVAAQIGSCLWRGKVTHAHVWKLSCASSWRSTHGK